MTARVTDTSDVSREQASDPGPPPRLELQGLAHAYRTRGRRHVSFERIDLVVAQREFVAVVGPSGCGKSTLLKVIGGLEQHTEGQLLLGGREVRGEVPDGVGIVFQNDALLPWRTVEDNIRFPLAVASAGREAQRDRVRELIELVGLSGFADYFPRQLSGGMRKRVALARTIAYDPQLYLMDEPFGPLDAQTRIRIGGEFLRIWEQLGTDVLFVTHDVEEAIALADRVVVMSAAPGHIKSVHVIDLPRPRNFEEVRFTEEFRRIHERIWHELKSEPGSTHGGVAAK